MSEIREDVVEDILDYTHGGGDDRYTLEEAVERVRTRLLREGRLAPSCGEVNEAARRGAEREERASRNRCLTAGERRPHARAGAPEMTPPRVRRSRPSGGGQRCPREVIAMAVIGGGA